MRLAELHEGLGAPEQTPNGLSKVGCNRALSKLMVDLRPKLEPLGYEVYNEGHGYGQTMWYTIRHLGLQNQKVIARVIKHRDFSNEHFNHPDVRAFDSETENGYAVGLESVKVHPDHHREVIKSKLLDLSKPFPELTKVVAAFVLEHLKSQLRPTRKRQ